MPIETLTTVKTMLGVSGSDDDTLLDTLRTAAEAVVQDYCGRSFAGGSWTEDLDGCTRILFLTNYPVSAVTSLKVDPLRGFGSETQWDPSRYVVYGDRGLIRAVEGQFIPGRRAGSRAIRVSYTTPSDAIPPAIGKAYADLVGHWYRQVKTAQATGQVNLLQQTTAGGVTQYPWGQAGGFRLPDGILQLLRPYRVPRV